MPDAIEQLRTATERDLAAAIGKLGPTHRRRIMDAIEVYGSASRIPPEVWESIRQDVDREAAALLLLLLAGVYGAQSQAVAKRAGVTATQDDAALKTAAAPSAARLGRQVADEYVSGIQSRLSKGIDAKADAINELPPRERAQVVKDEIDAAIGEDPAQSAIVDNTTRGVNAASDSAADDIGRQAGVRVTVIWQIEDGNACYICKALDGKTIDQWDSVLDANVVPDSARNYIENGGGAHPHCRCKRRYVVQDFSEN